MGRDVEPTDDDLPGPGDRLGAIHRHLLADVTPRVILVTMTEHDGQLTSVFIQQATDAFYNHPVLVVGDRELGGIVPGVGKVLKANENTDKEDVFLELSGVITSENFGHSHKVRLMVKEGLVIGETIEDATGHMHKFQFKIDALGAVDGEVDIAANVDNILHVHRLKIEPRSETFPFEQMSEFPENVAKKISDRPVQKGIVQKAWVPSEGAEIVELNFWGLKFPTQVQVGEWLNLHGIQAAVFQLSEFEYIARTKVPQANYSFVKMVDVEMGVMATITSKTDPWA